MKSTILAVDGGGEGFRRALIKGAEVSNMVRSRPLANVSDLIDFVKRGLNESVKGISYAMAGEIENHNRVVKSPNIHMLDGKNLANLTEEKTQTFCVVGNDMECAVMGMAALLSKEKYFMGITWSSGVGLRFYQDGKIIAESEGGHPPFDPSPYAPLCGCGVRGCAESILGGHAIQRRVINETEVQGINIPKDIDPNKFLDQEFEMERAWAQDIYELITTGMGTFLANMITLLRIPTIVWKGTFAKHALALPMVEDMIRDAARERLINPKWADEVKFIFSPDPENDGLIGAAKLFESLCET
jgi:glucokinase